MRTFEDCFYTAEERALRFLVDAHGFRVNERIASPDGSNWTGGLVRYSCETTQQCATPIGWTVTLAIAPERLELSLDIADEHGNSFSVEELHALVTTSPFPKRTHSLTDLIRNEEAQFSEFARLAGVLRQSGARFFTGDRKLWQELRAVREHKWIAEEDKRAVAQSEGAFKVKNWHQVVAALEPREARLSKAESARLSFARKKIQCADS